MPFSISLPEAEVGVSNATQPEVASSVRSYSDVLLFQGNDGGEIEVVNGQVAMGDGLATAIYISLFGGNVDDEGLAGDTSKQWWGNVSETSDARRVRSQAQAVLRGLPATTQNLRRLDDACMSDVSWLVDDVADDVSVSSSLPARNRVLIQVFATIDGNKRRFAFSGPWEPSS